MQTVHEKFLRQWIAQGGDNAPIGVGIATGELIVGEMGSAQRSDYTVIGKAANLGARICSVAQGGQVLICADTYAFVRDQVVATPIYGMEFKGVAGPVTVYEVTAVSLNNGRQMTNDERGMMNGVD
jgi:class 3 adenylate cyclase